MAIDISEYLEIIAGETEGEDVILAIHDASQSLGLEAYKTADISDLLENIKTKVFGREIRMDIYEILRRLAEAEPEPETSKPFIAGTMTPVFQGSLVDLAAGEIISGTAELEE
jgi:hypothetical protein